MLDSNIRGLFKRVEYQIANLKGLFSKNEKQMIDNINEFKIENEEFKDIQKYTLDKHMDNKNNPHSVTKTQVGLDKVDNVKQASFEEFSKHTSNNNNPHEVTKEQVGLNNVDNIKQATQVDFERHLNNNSNPHAVTKFQIGLGNVDNIEQATKTDFDNHIGDKVIHTSEAEKIKWNNAQLVKITADNGIPRIYVRDTNDSVLDKIIDNGLGVGTFYAVSNSKDLPPASRTIRGIYHMTDALNNKGTFGWAYATDFANVTYHNYLNNGSWRGWRQVLTDEELNSVWNQVTLINGTAQHNSINPLKYSIRQNVLHLRGSFENIPANETVIARFAQKPSVNTPFSAAMVGTYGFAMMLLTDDGSLRYEGSLASDTTKVNRIEINAAIPLW